MKTFKKKSELALIYLITISSLLTSACTTLQTKEANTNNLLISSDSHKQASSANNVKKIKIDWSLIYPDSIASFTKKNKTSGEYLSAEQLRLINIDYIYRKQIALDSLEYNYAVEQLAKQLEGRLVDSYQSSNEDEAKLFLVTRQDVVADKHDYIFRHGKLAGFVVSFVVLPIADRNVEDMIDVYSDDNWLPIEHLIEQYGGEIQNIGYNTKGFLIEADAYFSKPLNEAQTKDLEAQLKELTGVTIEVNQTGRWMF